MTTYSTVNDTRFMELKKLNIVQSSWTFSFSIIKIYRGKILYTFVLSVCKLKHLELESCILFIMVQPIFIKLITAVSISHHCPDLSVC